MTINETLEEAPTIKMEDDKCHALFQKVFRGLSLAEQRKEEVKAKIRSRKSGQLKAKSSDFKECIVWDDEVMICSPPNNEAAMEAVKQDMILRQEIEKVRAEGCDLEKEKKQLQEEIAKELAELAEIREKLHDLEVLGTHLWVRRVYEEKCEIFCDVKKLEKNLQQCTEQLFPALRQEFQEVQVAQGIYLDALKKESSALKLQLKDLQEKGRTLKADVAVLEAEEELSEEALQELLMRTGYIAGQAKNEQFLKAVEERRREKILSELEALAENVKEGYEKFKLLNDNKEQREV
ncbi:dynactin subunit 1-like isoform X2 [Macrobrachium nipponense]|uniref:dynactin subunit 1-like isoform X2 n=1 Tax=Macrobrachium nipponense TaxID=159736 RepID=UPI0030C7D6FE